MAVPLKSGFRLSFPFLLHVALVSQYIRTMKHTFLVPSSMLINLLLNLPQGGSVVESLKSTPPHGGFKQPSLWNRCQTGLRSSRRQNHIHLGYLKNKQTNKNLLHCQCVFICTNFFLVLHIEVPVSNPFAGRELGAFREMYYLSADNTGTVKQTAGRLLNFKQNLQARDGCPSLNN